MKKLFAVLAIMGFMAISCGGGGGTDTGIGPDDPADPGANPAPAAEGAPTISSISGTGADGIVFDSIKVTGSNYDDAMDVYLVKSGNTINLDYALIDDSEIEADLPVDIEPTEYELNVKNAAGKATAPLSLLQGEPGISLVHYYSCIGTTADLENVDNSDDKGSGAYIYEFSDGSYFMSCSSSHTNYDFLFFEHTYAVTFLKANLADTLGYISCIPYYVTANYYIDGNYVHYVDQSTNNWQDIACSQIY